MYDSVDEYGIPQIDEALKTRIQRQQYREHNPLAFQEPV